MKRTQLALFLAALTLIIGCTAEPSSTSPEAASADSTSAPAGDNVATDATADDSDFAEQPNANNGGQEIDSTSASTEVTLPEGALSIGSKAPALDIEHWISNGNGAFEAVTEFAAGQVYVVEFWATWCPPCVRSMPHLVEIQTKHKDAVQVISVSDEDLDTVTGFLDKPFKDGGDDGPETYGELTSAYCLTADPDRSTGQDYMEAAGQNGIPACFLVGKTGFIEWIGHPMELDEPLAKVLDDSWDREAYAVEFQKEQMFGVLMGQIFEAYSAKDSDKVKQLMEEARKIAGPRELMQLEQMEMNLKMAPIAEKMQAGDVSGAIADMEQLIASTDGPMKGQLNAVLDQLKDAAKQMEEAAAEEADADSDEDDAPAE